MSSGYGPGYVYVLEGDDGLIKIGVTRHIKDRIRQLSKTNPIVHVHRVIPSRDAGKLEEFLHALFYEYRLPPGEWFTLSMAQVNSIPQSEDEIYSKWNFAQTPLVVRYARRKWIPLHFSL